MKNHKHPVKNVFRIDKLLFIYCFCLVWLRGPRIQGSSNGSSLFQIFFLKPKGLTTPLPELEIPDVTWDMGVILLLVRS